MRLSLRNKFILSALCLLLAIGLNLFIGSTTESATEILFSLLHPSSDLGFAAILWQIRIPRIASGAFAGAALAAAGVLSQGLFRNPIASPSILGIECGGNLAAALVISFATSYLGTATIPLAAFAGCIATSLLLLALVTREKLASTEFLLLLGFAIGSLANALTSLVINLQTSDYRKVPTLLHWAMGSFSSTDWERMRWAAIPGFFGIWVAATLSRKLDILVFGEEIATTLGLSMMRLRSLTIVAISLLVASAISFGGAIPFVGLVVPHLSRGFYGPNHKTLLWTSVVHGAVLTLIADLVARTVVRPEEIPVGVLTALLGAPFFLWLLIDHRRGQV